LALLKTSSSGGPKGAEGAAQKIFGRMKACQKTKLLKKVEKWNPFTIFSNFFNIF